MKALVENTDNYATIEFTASNLHSRDATLFLKRQSDGLLSTGQAHQWLREIARIFPESKLALSIDELKVIPLTKKRRRLLEKKSRLNPKQYEMLLSFTFNK